MGNPDTHQQKPTQSHTSHTTPPRKKPKKGPSNEPSDLSEQLVAETLRTRRSQCSHSCGKGDCGSGDSCATGGCGKGSLLEMIANNFEYDDKRNIVEVTFEGHRRSFAWIEETNARVSVRDVVIVKTENGLDWASVSMTGSLVHAKRKAKRLSGEELPLVLRMANEGDIKRIEQAKASERQAYSVCKTRIEAFELPMDLIDAEWQFDHKKLTFYFTADGRVDFRALVRDLAAIFNTRIELRQIAVRDAAKRLGGVGICGLELCCTTHLGRYEHITLDHAKIQQIPANPSKLSGQCGRLKCCLLYEIDTYVEGLKRFPPITTQVKTPSGIGTVQKIDLFKELIWVYYVESSSWESLTLEQYKDILEGKAPKPVPKEDDIHTYSPSEPQRGDERAKKKGKVRSGEGSQKAKGEGKEKSKKKRRPNKGKNRTGGKGQPQGKEGGKNQEKKTKRGQTPKQLAQEKKRGEKQGQKAKKSNRNQKENRKKKPGQNAKQQKEG